MGSVEILQKESAHASHRDTRCSVNVLSEHASDSECQEELSEHSHCSDATFSHLPHRQVMSFVPASTPPPAVQIRAGTFGGNERFSQAELTVGPGAYNLPALGISGAGNFGQMTGDRFETLEQTVGPGEYNLPAGEISGAGNFGQMTGDRFETTELTVGPGEYNLPAGEISGAGNFGQMTGDRFATTELTAGPGEYNLPKGEISGAGNFG